jgi:hypothetical protein
MNERKNNVGLVTLDINAAFDCVWHDGLIFKLHRFGFPIYLIKIIKSFLSNRSFSVHLDGTKSNLHNIGAGVPQGSVLGPILYNIYTSDLPIPNNCFFSAFADDLAIGTTGLIGNEIVSNLQTALNILQDYLVKWKIKVNSEKSKAIYFTRKRKIEYKPQTNLKIGLNEIQWVRIIKYLGLFLDDKLTFKHHIGKTVDKINKTIKVLYPLINRNSWLSIENKLILMKTIFQPIMLYGASVWHDCAKSHISKLQISQNKVLKIMLNLPFFYSTKKLHEKTKISFIESMAKGLFENYNNKLQFSNNDLIKNLYVG